MQARLDHVVLLSIHNLVCCSSWRAKLQFLLTQSLSSVPHLAYQMFSMAVFFLQFLQWYSTYRETEGETHSITEAQSIPAPKLPNVSASDNLDQVHTNLSTFWVGLNREHHLRNG